MNYAEGNERELLVLGAHADLIENAPVCRLVIYAYF